MATKKQEVKEEQTTTTVEEKSQKTYIVVHDFKDLKDSGHVYIKGDSFPHSEDVKVSAARIKELSSTKNKINKVLIREQA